MIAGEPISETTSSATNTPRVIYLGAYVDELIILERGLPISQRGRVQQDGSSRAGPDCCGFRPVLLSPATSFRAWTWGSLLRPVRIHRAGPIPVVFAAMVNIPGLNILAAPLLQFLALRGLLRKGGTVGAVIYNFNPSLVLLAIYMKYIWKIRLVQNIEDISVPRLCDWLPNSGTRPVQQLVYWICQHAIARIVDDYVVPTRRFLAHLPKKPASAVVSGCIAINEDEPQHPARPLRVLYAGSIEREHGAHVFVNALKISRCGREMPGHRGGCYWHRQPRRVGIG